ARRNSPPSPAPARRGGLPPRSEGGKVEMDIDNGGTNHDRFSPTRPHKGWNRSWRSRCAHRAGAHRMGQGVGADGAVEARAERATCNAAVEVFRTGGRRSIRGAN